MSHPTKGYNVWTGNYLVSQQFCFSSNIQIDVKCVYYIYIWLLSRYMIYSKYCFLSYLSYIISVYYHYLSSNLNETISHHEGLLIHGSFFTREATVPPRAEVPWLSEVCTTWYQKALGATKSDKSCRLPFLWLEPTTSGRPKKNTVQIFCAVKNCQKEWELYILGVFDSWNIDVASSRLTIPMPMNHAWASTFAKSTTPSTELKGTRWYKYNNWSNIKLQWLELFKHVETLPSFMNHHKHSQMQDMRSVEKLSSQLFADMEEYGYVREESDLTLLHTQINIPLMALVILQS